MAAEAQKGLPRATFAKLSPHPYLLANLEPSDPSTAPSRSNGRSPRAARPAQVNKSSLTHAHGSSLVRVGDTTCICGVRAETLPVSDIPNYRPSSAGIGSGPAPGADEMLDYDLLVPNIELATGCAPQFLPGQPPTTLAQTLSTRVFSLLHASKMLDPSDLRIWYTPPSTDDDEKMQYDDDQDDAHNTESQAELKAYWVLYIDVFFISFDGNPFDAAWAAIVAALRDTHLPAAAWDPDREAVVCSREQPPKPLTVRGLPIACTAAVFTGRDTDRPSGSDDGKFWLLLDPDRLEEGLCDEEITAVVDRSGGETKILSIAKHGGTAASPELLRGYVAVAEKRWEEFKSAMEATS